jgi:hypothetical protein
MTDMKMNAIEQPRRSPVLWVHGYDGQAHYSDVIKAVAPALFMLAIIAAVMVTIF